MNTAHTIKMLTALSNGTNPFTGEAFPADSPYQHPQIVRALFQALRQIEAATAGPAPTVKAARTPSPANAARPANVGKPWSKDEDETLLGAYDGGATIDELALSHGRSRLGVEARLAKFGRVPMPERVRSRQERGEAPLPAEDAGEATQLRQSVPTVYQVHA